MILDLISPRLPLPPFQGWTIASDFAVIIAEHILRHKPQRVLELGSGLSTVVIAYALQKAGGGALISLEHDAKYLAATRKLLDAHGLCNVQILHRPLKHDWYEYSSKDIEKESVGLIVVDGPPGYICPQSRYPALPMLYGTLVDRGAVMLDDAARADEQQIIIRWRKEFPALRYEYLPTQKGTALFTKPDG